MEPDVGPARRSGPTAAASSGSLGPAALPFVGSSSGAAGVKIPDASSSSLPRRRLLVKEDPAAAPQRPAPPPSPVRPAPRRAFGSWTTKDGLVVDSAEVGGALQKQIQAGKRKASGGGGSTSKGKSSSSSSSPSHLA